MERRLKGSLALLAAALLLAGCSSAPAESAAPDAAQTPTVQTPAVQTPGTESAAEPEQSARPGDALPEVDIDGWEFIVANLYTYIGKYAPPSMASFTGQLLDERILEQAQALMDGAAEAGYRIYNSASYRSFDFYDYYYYGLIDGGMNVFDALKVAYPGGCSDHSTGLAIDFTDDPAYSHNYNHYTDPDFQDSELYRWLLDNCQDYGFIQRYPEGKEEYYGLACCPGHFRYVGVEAAKYIKDNGLCLEEFVALYK